MVCTVCNADDIAHFSRGCCVKAKDSCMAQGVLDASGFCCYGTVDSFGVCNGWDAAGQIAVTLLAVSASLASTSAVAGYLGTSAGAVHAVSSSAGWDFMPNIYLRSLSNQDNRMGKMGQF